ncbi:MAG: DegT/DnrJ/EryC1/StrS family aminotransferase, partial [Vicinamibacterales bacterium]|nr:DegT/DnrJ/EryC1/StrS family aminotransferase [Vicinamibacterales bacterium]
MLSAIGTADPLKLDAREIFGQLPASRVGDAERRYVDELYEAGFGNFESADMPGRLESTFAEKFGVGYGISMNSGSGTLLSCLIAAGVGPGDEVICPVYGMPAGAFATVHAASFSFQGSKHMTSGGDGGIV